LWLLQQELREPHDRGKRVVQLVRDSGERCPETRHALGASKQFVLALPLRDVLDDSVVPADFARLLVLSPDGESYGERSSVFPLPARFQPRRECVSGGQANEAASFQRIQVNLAREV